MLAKETPPSRRGCGSRCASSVAFFGGEPGNRGRAVADGAVGGRGKAGSKHAITAGPAERRVGRVCAERYGCWRVGWRMSGEHDAHGPVRRVGRLVRPIEADPVYVSYIEPCLRVSLKSLYYYNAMLTAITDTEELAGGNAPRIDGLGPCALRACFVLLNF